MRNVHRSLANFEVDFAHQAVACSGPHDGRIHWGSSAGACHHGIRLPHRAIVHLSRSAAVHHDLGRGIICNSGADNVYATVKVRGYLYLYLAGATQQNDAGYSQRCDNVMLPETSRRGFHTRVLYAITRLLYNCVANQRGIRVPLHPAFVTTALDLPGYRIVRSLGLVRGIVVRSRSVFGTIGASFQTLVGGDITLFTNLCERTRQDALMRMEEHAVAMGANAVVAFRYDANEVMQGVTEVLAYGTAVVVEPIS
jgi:uncharacterized protein YbjQ (UPF0145 family)